MADLASKKERNYLLDFWKFWGCVLVALCHYGVNMIGSVTNYDYMSQAQILDADFFYPKGVITLGFFTFTTGYWLMHAFKSMQRKGVFGKGHDFEICWRYTAKNYLAYAPLIFVAVSITYVVFNILNGSSFNVWVDTFVWDIWEFFGFKSGFNFVAAGDAPLLWGMGGELVEGTPYNFVNVTWYMSAIICFASVFFVMLMSSEKIAVFGIFPVLFAICMYTNNHILDGSGVLIQFFGNGSTRLWGPAIAGMWAWYGIDVIKRIDLSKKARNIMGWCAMLATVSFIYFNIVGNYGGMLNNDLHFIIVAIFTLINKDWFTQGVNKVLSKIPFIGEIQNFGLGIFFAHWSLIMILMRLYLPTHDLKSNTIVFVVACLACGVVWVIINKLVVAPLQKKLTKLFRLNTPIGEMFPVKETSAETK